MNQCRDCRWWENRGTEKHPSGVCTLALSVGRKPLHADTLMVAEGNEGAAARVITAPHFGCIQWAGR